MKGLQQNKDWTDEKIAGFVRDRIVKIDGGTFSVKADNGSEWRGSSAAVIVASMISKRDRPFRKYYGGKA